MAEIIKYNNKELTLKTATNSPNLVGRTAIVSDRWEYVRFFLKNTKKNKAKANEALFYWNQAEEFYKSSEKLSLTSIPLPLYYCFLNATKALLEFKYLKNYSPYHGVTGYNYNKNITKPMLDEQIVQIKPKGVCPSLLEFLGANSGKFIGNNITFDKLLGNLVYIHRTFVISQGIPQHKEIFIPLDSVCFIRKPNKKVTVRGKIDDKYRKHNTVKSNKLKKVSVYVDNSTMYLSWKKCKVKLKDIRNVSYNKDLIKFHKEVRDYFQEISSGINSRWYFKDFSNSLSLDLPPLVIMYMCMHRLSELSRYEPQVLSAYLEKEHSWLISEFLKSTPFQFINAIAAEITGEQLGVPRHIVDI